MYNKIQEYYPSLYSTIYYIVVEQYYTHIYYIFNLSTSLTNTIQGKRVKQHCCEASKY